MTKQTVLHASMATAVVASLTSVVWSAMGMDHAAGTGACRVQAGRDFRPAELVVSESVLLIC